MIKLRLLNPKLQFVPYGKGKVHAHWNGIMPASGMDISKITMCGRDITDEIKPLADREMDKDRLCGNCSSSLMMYGPSNVEREVSA